MITISLANVSLILGARPIFRNLTWEIQHDQRIGLIGPNGAGKSSLFKLITGEFTPEPGGAVVKAKGVTVGYLPQDPDFDPGLTALAVTLAGNARLAEVEAELTRVEARLADSNVYNDPKALARALETQQKYLEAFDALGGENYEARVRETLRGLGLPKADFDKPIRALSGGQKKLVGLARLLLARPSVLLLDEPDNHLDLAGKEYLERLITGYPGAVVIISHDRYLLDAVVTHIVEIEDGKLTTFAGDYTAYIVDKEERLARAEELYQIQQREIARLEAALKRYAMWTLLNDKFASRKRAMETRLARMERRERPVLERRRMGLELNGWRGSNKVLELAGMKKSFGAGLEPTGRGQTGQGQTGQGQTLPLLLQEVNLLIRHGERVGLIGANGAGKSVLLRIIIGQEQPDAGEVKIGPSVKAGYYAQEHETLNREQTPLEAVRHAARITEEGAVGFLRKYLFTYQQVSQKIKELSGGERSRLQLALLVLSGANFLLLDEPTNNLDIASAEVLENALEDFEGTALVISHDRYFLDRTVSRIVELEGGRLTEYIGAYSDYAEKKGVGERG
ncbi:MAG TPA: ABC-F family ATP-binding cassette domain-containing protein, partial [Anaerolineales bacterium]|nr:ABC-F family ATP-binding cassette domain-containing protein [Anaerolineales bacterium]